MTDGLDLYCENLMVLNTLHVMKGNKSSMSSGDEIYVIMEGSSSAVIATINADGSFMISLPEGSYEIKAYGGTILKQGILIEKGKITDIGSL
jgi:hypothetical protein